jgi:uncharacterized membrane protein
MQMNHTIAPSPLGLTDSELRRYQEAGYIGPFPLLAEHAIEIIADRGLNAHVSPAQWAAIVATMREAFRAGRHEQGLNAAIDAVDALLRQHFAMTPGQDNPNELPDAPDLR